MHRKALQRNTIGRQCRDVDDMLTLRVQAEAVACAEEMRPDLLGFAMDTGLITSHELAVHDNAMLHEKPLELLMV